MPNLPFLATSYARLEPRPLPSAGVTRLPQYYGPLRHPVPPSLALAGVWLDVRPVHGKGLPVLPRSSCADMPSPLSRRIGRLRSSLASPALAAFPEIKIGSASALVIFGTCSAFTHVMACQLVESPTRPSTSKASAASLPPRLLRLLPAGAKIAGRGSHPLKDRAFARRTNLCTFAESRCNVLNR